MKTDLGAFSGKNRPSDILHTNRAENWRDFTVFLVACCILTFGWMGWAL